MRSLSCRRCGGWICASTVLSLHAWGKSDVRGFGWYEPPGEEMVAAAERLLEMLGALEDGAITTIGRQLDGDSGASAARAVAAGGGGGRAAGRGRGDGRAACRKRTLRPSISPPIRGNAGRPRRGPAIC